LPTPRKSLEQHALEGTKAHYDSGKQTSHIPGARPYPPKWMNERAAKKFRQIARVLDKRRVATSGDAEMISLYAVLWDRWQEANEHVESEGQIIAVQKLAKDGHTYTINIVNPWLKIAQVTEKQMTPAMLSLGLAVNSRDKAKQTAAEPKREVIPGSAEDFFNNVVPIATIRPMMTIKPEEMESGAEDDEDADH
jgi:P27 family predicted phage terminase small subunit